MKIVQQYLLVLFFIIPVFSFAQKENSMVMPDSLVHQFTKYNSPLPDNNVTTIVITPDQKTQWIATWGGGVSKHTGSKWLTYTTANSALSSNFINDMVLDKNNKVWLATNQNGVVGFNGRNWEVYEIGNSNTILSIQVDDENNIWVGTYSEGLFKINSITKKVTKVWGGENAIKYAVQSICFDAAKTAWIDTNKGIYKMEGDKMVLMKTDSSAKKQKTNYAIAVDSKGNIWCAGFPTGSLQMYDGSHWITYEETAQQALGFKKMKEEKPDPTRQFYKHAFYLDKDDNIYLGTQYHGAIAKFDGTTWSSVLSNDAKENNYNYAAITLDTNGIIYAGTWKHGMINFKEAKHETIDTTHFHISEIMGRTVITQHIFATETVNGTLQIFDQGLIDGDVISLYLNDKLLLENYTLVAAKKEIPITLLAHSENKIIVYAQNLGTTPPSTSQVIVTIGGVQKRYTLNSDFKKCGAVRIDVK